MKSKTVKGIKEDFNVAKKQVKDDFSVAKEKVKLEFKKAKEKLSEAQRDAESYIAKNPKRATAIAVGVGAAIGASVTAYLMSENQ